MQNTPPQYMVGAANPYQTPNQTLPVISLILGIVGVVFCCYGFPFGVAALVTGFLGFNNVNKDPMNYGGRGLAIAGMIMGAISLFVMVIFVLIGIAGS